MSSSTVTRTSKYWSPAVSHVTSCAPLCLPPSSPHCIVQHTSPYGPQHTTQGFSKYPHQMPYQNSNSVAYGYEQNSLPSNSRRSVLNTFCEPKQRWLSNDSEGAKTHRPFVGQNRNIEHNLDLKSKDQTFRSQVSSQKTRTQTAQSGADSSERPSALSSKQRPASSSTRKGAAASNSEDSDGMTEEVKHARFDDKKCRSTAERGRVLTMKYGKQQMMLIRKRMNVENWLDEQLTALYNGEAEIDIDVDEILDMETISERKRHVLDLFQRTGCPASMAKINGFLDQMIQKLDTL